MSAQTVYLEIINKVKRIYQTYEDRANQVAQDKRKKTGNKTQKIEEEFLKETSNLEQFMTEFIQLMKREERGAKNEFLENVRAVETCLSDIKAVLKKKTLNFKANPEIRDIINETRTSIEALKKSLPSIKETKTLGCCGTDGIKVFKTPMNHFKIQAGKWRMMVLFEPKDGVQTFISPKYSENQYQFISDIIKRNWPKQLERQVVVKQVKVQVPVDRVVHVSDPGKPSALNKANQCLYGINREQNITEGLQTYHTEAQKGNPQACCFLGKAYEEGLLLSKDISQAKAYYSQAIKGNDSYAQYRYALCLIKGKFSPQGQNKKDIEEGFKLLKKIADSQTPSPEALTELGQVYQYGHFQSDVQRLFSVQTDTNKAILHYKKARNYKLPRASNNLAVLYLNAKMNEKEGKSDLTSALESDANIVAYLQEAKEAGFSQAYYNLGSIFSKGLLSQKDSEKALTMFYEGSIKGDYKCKIKFAYELMNQTSIMKQQYEDHYLLAIQWLENVIRKFSRTELYDHANHEQVTKHERAQALFYLGLFHQHGFGVEKSPKKSIHYFIESAGLQYAAAKNKLGDCYFSGYGVRQDRQLAIGQYMEAAEGGNSDAMVNLGSVYLNGVPGILQKNYRKAREYFLSAHNYENTDALIHLSFMYRNGLEVDQDDELARNLLEEAAQAKNATALYMLREQGIPFNEGILFQHLQNQFLSSPKKLNIKEVVPVIKTQYRSRVY